MLSDCNEETPEEAESALLHPSPPALFIGDWPTWTSLKTGSQDLSFLWPMGIQTENGKVDETKLEVFILLAPSINNQQTEETKMAI